MTTNYFVKFTSNGLLTSDILLYCILHSHQRVRWRKRAELCQKLGLWQWKLRNNFYLHHVYVCRNFLVKGLRWKFRSLITSVMLEMFLIIMTVGCWLVGTYLVTLVLLTICLRARDMGCKCAHLCGESYGCGEMCRGDSVTVIRDPVNLFSDSRNKNNINRESSYNINIGAAGPQSLRYLMWLHLSCDRSCQLPRCPSM